MATLPSWPLDAFGHRLTAAGPADAPALLDLARAFHAEDGHALSAKGEHALTQLLADETLGLVLKIEANGSLIGYAALCWSYSIELGGRDVFLDDLYVAPEERGRGLGRSVMETLLGIAREAGCAAFHLEVMAGSRAEPFYRVIGFKDRDSTFLTLRL